MSGRSRRHSTPRTKAKGRTTVKIIDQHIPNAKEPTPGQGLALDTAGKIPSRLLRPGLWYYATPISPADTPGPSLYDPGDRRHKPFQNGWLNTLLEDGTTYSPLRWRVRVDGKKELEGAIDGGALGTVCVTLPEEFWPKKTETVVISSVDGTRAMTVSISATNGDVTVIGFPQSSVTLSDNQVTTSIIADGAVTSAKLATTGAGAGTYGSSTQAPQITVGTDGRISAVSNVTILNNTGVTASTYGDSTHVGQFTVGADGRLTAASSISITGSGSVASADGWVDDSSETWTYSSSTAFTISGSDLTAQFSPGTRIKLTQSATVKYFVVSSSSFASSTTTVNITGGSDYTLANSAISANFHSYEANPQGYPGYFNYTPTIVGFSSTSTVACYFAVVGRICTVFWNIAGTSNSASFNFTAPISSAITQLVATGLVVNNGAAQSSPGRAEIGGASGSGTIDLAVNMNSASGGWNTTNTKQSFGQMMYRI